MQLYRSKTSCSLSPECAYSSIIQVLPAGNFYSITGVKYSAHDPQNIIARSMQRAGSRQIVIDYEHQTEYGGKYGTTAPAAGWVKHFSASDQGIWASVEWTERARQHILNKEYKYISPVFEYDKQGRVHRILRASLTNNPALQMKAICSAEHQETIMQETELQNLKAALARKFRLSDGYTSDDLLNALLKHSAPGSVQDQQATAAASESEMLQKELAALKESIALGELLEAVETACCDGRVTPAMKPHIEDIARVAPDKVRDLLNMMPPIVNMDSRASGSLSSQTAGSSRLNEKQRALCHSLDIPESDFLKNI